jgi:hypothetical protein
MNNLPSSRATAVTAYALVLVGALVAASLLLVDIKSKAAAYPSLSIAIIGDSYAAGELNRVVWPTLLAQRSGWSVSNFALPGAGFAADGRGGHAFTYQVDRAQAAHPQIILIATGQADNRLRDMEPVRLGAVDVLKKIELGGQRALVMGPTWYATPVPEKVQKVSEAVGAIDPPWLTRKLMQADLASPTDAGQSLIADRVLAWLHTVTGI